MRVEDLREQEAVVEAVLFTMGRSVEIRHLAAALETGEPEAEAAAERLKARYEESVCGMQGCAWRTAIRCVPGPDIMKT